MGNSNSTVLEEVRRLAGLTPRWVAEKVRPGAPGPVVPGPGQKKNIAPDTPNVTDNQLSPLSSKEYRKPSKESERDGGDAGGGTGDKTASVGGTKAHPGINAMMTRVNAPHGKESGEIDAGGGLKKATIGGTSTGPGQNPRTKNVKPGNSEGGYVKDGGGSKETRLGGSTLRDIKRVDDKLRAERNERMRGLIAIVEGDYEEVEEGDSDEENFQ